MGPEEDAFDAFLQEHRLLRRRLVEWQDRMEQLAGGSVLDGRRTAGALSEFSEFLERESRCRFRAEECVLYTEVEQRLPRLCSLLSELRQELDVFHQVFEEFRREMTRFHATGEPGKALALAREVLQVLCHQADKEGRELHPVLLKELRQEDRWRLRRRLGESEAA